MNDSPLVLLGAQYKGFMRSAPIFGVNAFIDDVSLRIDGVYYGENDDLDDDAILDEAMVEVLSGDVYTSNNGQFNVISSLEAALQNWLAQQTDTPSPFF